MTFQRFSAETPPPYGPFKLRYKFGVTTIRNGKRHGIVTACSHPPTEEMWQALEREVANS